MSFLTPREPDPAAPFLFSEEDFPQATLKLLAKEGAGEFTGERLFFQEPKIYGAIVRMLGADMTVQLIADLLEVSDHTVRNVRARESASIADFRAKQGVRRRKVLDLLIERIEEKAPTAELKDAVIAYGILDDKERLDSGSPTQILGTTKAKPAADQFVAWMAEKGVPIDVPMTVTALPTGLEAGVGGTNGGGVVEGLDSGDRADLAGKSASDEGVVDVESADSQSNEAVDTGEDTGTEEQS